MKFLRRRHSAGGVTEAHDRGGRVNTNREATPPALVQYLEAREEAMGNEIQKHSGNGGAPQTGITARQEFGAQQLARSAELATAAVAAQAKAEVEARYVMALQRPRDFDDVRARFLKECQRPGFAKVARYAKPVGGSKIEGPSIRFVEAAIRCMGNIIAPTAVIFEDRERRIVRVSVTDLESNVTYPSDIVIEKTVERRDQKGRQVLGERTNSQGQTVYIVLATEDELLNKQAALVSKAVRTNGLRVIPGDLIEEGQGECIATLRDRAAKDPDAEKKAIIDAFGGIGIPPAELRKYLGHTLDTLVAAEIVELRQVYAALKDGEATWQDTLDEKLSRPMDGTAPPTPIQAQQAAPQPQDEMARKAAEIADAAEKAQHADDALAKCLDGIRVAKTQKELNALARQIAALPQDQQPAAREAFNTRSSEIANAAS